MVKTLHIKVHAGMYFFFLFLFLFHFIFLSFLLFFFTQAALVTGCVNLDVALRDFCEMLEDFCNRAEGTNDEVDEEDGSPLHLADIKQLLNKIISFREKKPLHLVPVEDFVRLLNILDRQIQLGQVLSIDENESVSVFLVLFDLTV